MTFGSVATISLKLVKCMWIYELKVQVIPVLRIKGSFIAVVGIASKEIKMGEINLTIKKCL